MRQQPHRTNKTARFIPVLIVCFVLGGSSILRSHNVGAHGWRRIGAQMQANNAIEFGSSGAYVTFGPAPGLGVSTFTLETWFKREGTGLTAFTGNGGAYAIPLVTKGRAEDDGSNVDMNFFLGIRGSDNVLLADFEEGAGGASPGLNHPIAGVTAITNNVWYHAAATYDGTRWQLYLNGMLENQLTVGQPPRSDSIQHAALGTALNSTGVPDGAFNGIIDEARVWNYARTAQQILATKDTEVTSAAGLVARWGLNEGTGTTIGDSAGAGITGTIAGSGSRWVSGAPFNAPANHPPNLPTMNSPADLQTGVATSPTLDVSVSDPDLDNLTVTFFGKKVSSNSASNFTVVAIPDTQHYLDTGRQYIFTAQTQWIVNNRAALNTVFVTHLGDIVQDRDLYEQEWRDANTSMNVLDAAGIPYNSAPGNHDMSSSGVASFYDQYFPVSRYLGQPWYGGYLGSSPNDPINRKNKDNYELFSVGSLDFIILHLEYDIPNYSLAWADRVLKAYPNRRAIISTHAFLDETGVRPTEVVDRPDGTTAEQVWQQLIKKNCNVFLVINGHYWGEADRTDLNDCGKPVHQICVDYQERINGGDGWLRYLTFKPAENKIYAYSYSPTRNGGLGEFETDTNSQFTLDYSMQSSDFQVIATSANVVSGSNATATWANLSPGAEYEWYVTVSDGINTTTSSHRRFTTDTAPGANHPPVVNSPGNQASVEGDTISLQIAASDADGDRLTYSAANLPSGLSINSSSGLISGTIANTAAAGSPYAITVTASDGLVTGSASFTWTISRVTAPDLIVSAISAPGSAKPGATISVNSSTKNQGSGSAAASTTRFYLSTDTAVDAADTILGKWSVSNLSPGATSSGAISVKIPTGLALGTYYIIARADADGSVQEADENNNIRLVSISIKK